MKKVNDASQEIQRQKLLKPTIKFGDGTMLSMSKSFSILIMSLYFYLISSSSTQKLMVTSIFIFIYIINYLDSSYIVNFFNIIGIIKVLKRS